jgi:hypothetical protein
MALKRINKELTDLGRYVVAPFCCHRHADMKDLGGAALPSGVFRWIIKIFIATAISIMRLFRA